MKILLLTLLTIASSSTFAATENSESSRVLQQAKKVAKEETLERPAHAYLLGSLAAKKHKALQASNSVDREEPESLRE
jgi:hypothetical protein